MKCLDWFYGKWRPLFCTQNSISYYSIVHVTDDGNPDIWVLKSKKGGFSSSVETWNRSSISPSLRLYCHLGLCLDFTKKESIVFECQPLCGWFLFRYSLSHCQSLELRCSMFVSLFWVIDQTDESPWCGSFCPSGAGQATCLPGLC